MLRVFADLGDTMQPISSHSVLKHNCGYLHTFRVNAGDQVSDVAPLGVHRPILQYVRGREGRQGMRSERFPPQKSNLRTATYSQKCETGLDKHTPVRRG